MQSPYWPLVSAREMRALDQYTISSLGVPGELLMESAGRACVREILDERPGAGPIVVVAGTGNNGGDGFVIARHLSLLGVPAEVWLVGDRGRVAGDAAANLERLSPLGVRVRSDAPAPEGPTVVVDALFGTGLSRALADEPADAVGWIARARSAGARVVAVDLPSGLDADTGQPLGVAVGADRTVTLGLPKRGLALEPGRSLAGHVRVARIGIADETPDLEPLVGLWTRASAADWLPRRPAAGHKGTFGHALLVAGSGGKTGAAALAVAGAHRSGAGLVTLACPEGSMGILGTKCTEAMTSGLAEGPDGAIGPGAEKSILELAAGRDVVGVGPGLGRSPATCEVVRLVTLAIDRPMLLDADALFAFSDDPAALRSRTHPTVLTPHPGEAARLLGTDAAALNRDRIAGACRLAELTGAVAILKGAATVIAEPGGRVLVNPTGGPVLGAGGSGDVLAGIVTGLLAQGLPAFEAAALGVFVHGAAADRLATVRGDVGILASEVAAEVPSAIAALAVASSREPFGAADALDFPEPG